MGQLSEIVRWEKLLPRMVLRVLLVEADDSTRRIIAALLRKCNYKVAAVSDGLEAWEILKQRHHDIDLILTELDLPSISGYALLTLIMEHDGCKNIPVVIMSSQDSISMVLKCMLKGAADFLIKPVRRNELKNLWRHVWRRLAVDVGHSKPRNPATGQLKKETTFENDLASKCSCDNVPSSRKDGKSSQKESEAQSSCTTHYLKAGYTCVENMHGSLQKKHREGTGLTHKETSHHADDAPLVEAFALASSDSGQKEAKFTSGGDPPSGEAKISAAFKANIATEDGNSSLGSHRHMASKEVVDLMGRITKHKRITGQPSSSEELNRHNPTPELELTLKSSNDAEMEEVDKMHIFNHYKASAFSRCSSNKKLRTVFPSSVGDPKEIQGVAQTSPWSKEIKPEDFVAQSMHGEPLSLSPQVGLVPIPGVIFDGVGVCYATNSVDPSGCSSTPCNNDNATQQRSSTAYGSVSVVTDVDAGTTPGCMTESARDDGGNAFDLDKFRSRTGHCFSAEREAALAKFRLKRKGRCFEKKVRYQSRKRLAEQRPRVKGQFVRLAPSDPVITNVDNL